MINKIIKEYLQQSRRLVVPQFGAFIHKEVDGEVVFVPFLKKDDGVLVGILRRDYTLGEEEANAVITEFILTVQQSISSRGNFMMDGVGQLISDANGVYTLLYNPGAKTKEVDGFASTPTSNSRSVSGNKPIATKIVETANSQAVPTGTIHTNANNTAPVSESARSVETSVSATRVNVDDAPDSQPEVSSIPKPSLQKQQPISQQHVIHSGAPQSTVSAHVRQSASSTSPVQSTPSTVSQSALSSQPVTRIQPIVPPTSSPSQSALSSQPMSAGQAIQRPITLQQQTTAAQTYPTSPRVASTDHSARPLTPPPYKQTAKRMESNRQQARYAQQPKNKADKFMVIAIIAAAIAVAAMIYGAFAPSNEPDFKVIPPVTQDSTVVK